MAYTYKEPSHMHEVVELRTLAPDYYIGSDADIRVFQGRSPRTPQPIVLTVTNVIKHSNRKSMTADGDYHHAPDANEDCKYTLTLGTQWVKRSTMLRHRIQTGEEAAAAVERILTMSGRF